MTYQEQQYEEFAKKMESNFPKMFDNPYGGFAVGPGWWPILEHLCGQIQHHVDWRNQQKEKFNRGEGCPQVIVEQIKEKFGGLRFYYQGGDDYVSGLVSMAETWAEHSCEDCGNLGERRSGGWIRTLCDHHEQMRQLEMKKRFNNED